MFNLSNFLGALQFIGGGDRLGGEGVQNKWEFRSWQLYHAAHLLHPITTSWSPSPINRGRAPSGVCSAKSLQPQSEATLNLKTLEQSDLTTLHRYLTHLRHAICPAVHDDCGRVGGEDNLHVGVELQHHIDKALLPLKVEARLGFIHE